MRNSLALALIVVAAVLTLPAAVAAWEQRVLMNEDRFVSVGNDVLSKDAVQRELAKEIARDISSTIDTEIPGLGSLGSLTNDPALKDVTNILGSLLGLPTTTPSTPSKPNTPAPTIEASVFEPLVLDIVRTLPNTEVTEIPLRATHGLVTTAVRSDVVRPEDDNIVLDLSDTLAQLVGDKGLGLFSAQISGDAGQVVLVRRSDMAPAFDWARRLDGKAMTLAVIPLAVLAVGFFLAANRALYAVYAGLGLAVSAGIWILLAKGPLRSSILDDATIEASSRAAAEATYDVVVATFVQQEIIVAGAGVVLVILGLVLSGRVPGRRDAAA
ncbi:MAG TPA: hypothetical protein VJB57_01700 [Dehalococcoidia bacterium]|nr:hypothetical protein [Dehalococcoidia bacterium]